jgi:cold shock CspA family protein
VTGAEAGVGAGVGVGVGVGVRRYGSVVEFDEAVGLGTVRAPASGGGDFPFHCTQIADGSRRIPVGADVSFVVLAGRGGRWEAGDLRVS